MKRRPKSWLFAGSRFKGQTDHYGERIGEVMPKPQDEAPLKPYWLLMLKIIGISLAASYLAATFNAPLWLGAACVLPGFSAFGYLLAYVIQQINRGEGL